jgi:biopolymer transport protein ExbD
MALKSKFGAKAAEGDMTAMIDMVFQLIIFFMVLINFSQDDQNQAIKLPTSELAKPAEIPLENPLVLNLAFNGNIYFGAETATIAGLRPLLELEANVLKSNGKSAKDANVIMSELARQRNQGSNQRNQPTDQPFDNKPTDRPTNQPSN